MRFDRDVKTELPKTLIGREEYELWYEPGPGESVQVQPTEFELKIRVSIWPNLWLILPD